MTRLRPHVPALLGALAGVTVICWLGLVDWQWSDYDREASGAFNAIAAGHVGAFVGLAPAYGGSLVLRAPFALLAGLLGGGERATAGRSAPPRRRGPAGA